MGIALSCNNCVSEFIQLAGQILPVAIYVDVFSITVVTSGIAGFKASRQ